MPYSETGLLADPNFRRDRARKAAAVRNSLTYFVARVLERADELTPDHRTALALTLRRAGRSTPPVDRRHGGAR